MSELTKPKFHFLILILNKWRQMLVNWYNNHPKDHLTHTTDLINCSQEEFFVCFGSKMLREKKRFA